MPVDPNIPLAVRPYQGFNFNALAQDNQQREQNAFLIQQQREQAEANKQAAANRQQVTGMAAEGNVRGAQQAALAGGDIELYNQLMGMEKGQLEHEAALAKGVGIAAQSVLKQPYEVRRQAMVEILPYLKQYGITEQDISGIDPTDQNLTAIIDTVQGFDEALKMTEKMQNVAAMGLRPGTPEFQAEMARQMDTTKYIPTTEGGGVFAASPGQPPRMVVQPNPGGYEAGAPAGGVETVTVDGKTYYVVGDKVFDNEADAMGGAGGNASGGFPR